MILSVYIKWTLSIGVQGGDSSGMSETDEISQRRVATVIAHRSPRETRPPETEITSIIYSFFDSEDKFTLTVKIIAHLHLYFKCTV